MTIDIFYKKGRVRRHRHPSGGQAGREKALTVAVSQSEQRRRGRLVPTHAVVAFSGISGYHARRSSLIAVSVNRRASVI